ncbi:MAG: gliding motility-associated C-terminal domain-containing protein [Bacteroidota bacterium]
MSEKYKQMKAHNTFRKLLQVAMMLLVISAFEINPVRGQFTVTIVPSGGQTQVCQGSGSFTLTVQTDNGVGDPSNFTYSWTGDTHVLTIVPPGDVAILNTNSPAGTYNFTCDVTDEGSNTASDNISIEILQSPTSSISTTDPTTFCQGGSALLKAVTGVNYAYQWRKDGADISGATSDQYSATLTGVYRARVTLTTTGCSKLSNNINITVNPLPNVTASNDGPACYNGTINLTSTPDGMVSYSWSSNSTIPFTSSNQNPSITNVTPDNSGDYTVTVQDANGCINSAQTTVLVYDQLNGGTIGSDQTICYNGDPDPFTNITAPSGGNGSWTYQWQEKVGAGSWTDISGATGLTYDVPAGLTQTTLYRRAATTSCGTVYSNTITVTVYAALNGGTISSDQSICYAGNPVAFNNDASASGGDGSFTYQWQLKVGAGSWTDIGGATGLTYDVPAGLTQTTQYRRVATNSCGIVYSNELTVTVYDQVTGGTIGSDQSVCYNGDPAAFTDLVSPAGGTGARTYSWEQKVGAGPWTNIAGANGLTYDVPAGITQTTQYRRKAENTCGFAYSNEITVTVYPQLDGGTIAGNQSLCYNSDPDPITSTVDPSGGNGPWTYSWEYQSNCAGPWITIPGANGLTYDPPANQTETRCYRRVASNSCGTVYSNTVTITIYADINGGAIASDQTVCYGDDPVAFTSSSSASGGNGAFTYFWEQDTGSGWVTITGANNLTYDPPAGITQTTSYRRGATNSCGTGYSNTLTVTVAPAVDGGVISTPAPVCYNGDPDAFTNVTSPSGGSGAWTYDWEYKEGAGPWTSLGVNSLTYDIPAGQTTTRTYRRVATNSCGTGYSNEVTVIVYPDITAGSINGDQTLCYNSDPLPLNNVTLPSGGDGTWTYSWEYQSNCAGGWTSIAEATGSSYDPPAGLTETRCYRRVETNACGVTYSNTLTITIIPEITGNTISSDQTICFNDVPAQLTGPVPGGGSGAYSYRWQQSTTGASGPFTNISGATSQNYSPPALTSNTWYRRVVTSGSCVSISNVVAITVLPAIGNNIISANQNICYNSAPAQLDGSTPTGGDGTYTYQWQSSTAGAGGPFANIAGATGINYQPGVLTQTTWFRRMVNSGPCVNNPSNVIQITVASELKVDGFTTVNPTCNGYSNGQATVNVSGGTPGYSYSWNTSPVQTNQTATNLSAGVNYTVTVTDALNCQALGNVMLTEPAAIGLASKTVVPVSGCSGNTNGSIQALASGGTPNYTYTLYLGANLIGTQNPAHPTPATFTNLATGTYTLSITDVNGCPAYTEDILVSEPDPIVISDVATTPISCNGYADGTITITASGGTGILEYSIDNGANFQLSNTFTVGDGYYDIVVRDANGCSATWPTTVEMVDPNSISFTYEVTQITTCYGDNTGKITISNVAGGSGSGYEFSIYQPEVWGSNPVFTNLPGGPTNPYYIKVRDSHGCVVAANNGNPIYINQPSPITYNVVTTNVTGCWYNTNGTIKVNGVAGGTGLKQVSIDGVTYYATTYTFNVGVGSYTVYVKDANGCIVTKPAVITGPPAIVINTLTVTDVTCFGGNNGEVTASASGGTGALEYSIDGINYFASGNFTGLTAGNYTMYVRDLNGCILTQDFTVGQPPALFFTTRTKTDITCNGLSDGTITLVASGGTAPYNYSITGGAPFGNATGLFTGLGAGTYTPAVQDANGCITIGTDLTIIEPAPLSVATQSSTDITCFGANDGAISVTGTGGTAPLTYSLLDAGSIVIATNGTGTFTNLSAGTYTVEINDANSCGPIVAGPFTIVEPTQLTFTYTTVDLICNGDGNGQISVNASGGTPPYEYSYDGGNTFEASSIKNGLSGGIYNVVVRDANLCTTSQNVTINEPAPIILNVSSTNITCNGLSDGQINVSVTGGVAPLQYRINGGAWQGTGLFIGLSANNYLVEVMDNNGCMASSSTTISEPPAITIDNISTVNPTCSSFGSITVVASGGTGTLTYTLNPGAISNTTGVFNGLGAGTYTVDVTDANGCGPVTSGPIILSSPSLISIDNINVTNVTGCYGDNNGSIEIIASGGTPPLQYSIDGGTTFYPTNIFTNLTANDYIVVVNDVNNCPQSQLVTITQPSQLVINNVNVVQESTPGANDGEIHVIASGGTGALTYTLLPNNISNGTGDFTGLGTGTYKVRVSDVNGCNVETGDLVISGVNIDITSSDVSCFGLSDGLITITITGGFPPFTVLCTRLSDMTPVPVNDLGGNIFTVENISAGSYLISITDNISTVFPNRQVDIVEPAQLNAAFVSLENPLCNGQASGSVTFDITGGTPVYTITWAGGTSIGNVATGVAVGSYTDFTITDSHGCSTVLSDVPPMVEPSAIQLVELVQFDPTCNGQAIGAINVTASGGTGTLTYSISGTLASSNTSGVFENLPAGVYDIAVTDDNGCSANFDPPLRVTLSEPPAIIITGLTPADSLACPNDPSGYVRVQVNGGQPDYTFLWSNGQTTMDLENIVVGKYWIKVTDALNCSVTDTFEVKGPAMLKLSANIQDAYCREINGLDKGRITIESKTGGTGNFSELTFEWLGLGDTDNELANITSGNYTLRVTDTKGCVYDTTFFVGIENRYNFKAIAGNDTTVCFNNPVTLVGSVSGGDPDLAFLYYWNELPSNTQVQEGNNLSVSLTESKSYVLRVYNSGTPQCIEKDTINLNVLPEIGLHVPLYISAVQDTVISILMGKEYNIDVITKSVDYATTFEWKPAEMFSPSDSWNSQILFTQDIKNQIPQNRIVKIQDPITKRINEYILVDVIAKTEAGCTDSIRLYTKVVDDLAFGNVFSPNGDGINDVWRVPKSYLFPDLSIEIFNRWGSLVWSATGDKAAKGWDGKSNNGKELPIGTYYYVIKFNIEAQGANWKPITGSVTIVK